MRILCNLTLGPGNTTDFALSVGEDEDGTICVAMIGELSATYMTSASGGSSVKVGSGYWVLSDAFDAEEVTECAKWLQEHYSLLQVGETVPPAMWHHLARIADVLYGLGEATR